MPLSYVRPYIYYNLLFSNFNIYIYIYIYIYNINLFLIIL